MNKNKRNLCILCLCVMLFCILFKLYSGNNSILEQYADEGEGAVDVSPTTNGSGEGCDNNTIKEILNYFNGFNIGTLSIKNDFSNTISANLNLKSITLYDSGQANHTHGIHNHNIICNEDEDESNQCVYQEILNGDNLQTGLTTDLGDITENFRRHNKNILDNLDCTFNLVDEFYEGLSTHKLQLHDTSVDNLISNLFNSNGENICNNVIKKIVEYNEFINSEDNVALSKLNDPNGQFLTDIKNIKEKLKDYTNSITWGDLLSNIDSNFKNTDLEGSSTLKINDHMDSIMEGIAQFIKELSGDVEVNDGHLNQDITTLKDSKDHNIGQYAIIRKNLDGVFRNILKESSEELIHHTYVIDIRNIENKMISIDNRVKDCLSQMKDIQSQIDSVNTQLATNIAQQGSGAYAGNIGSIVQQMCFDRKDDDGGDVCYNYLRNNVYGPSINNPGCVVQCSVRDHTGNCLVVDEDSVNLYANIYGDAPMKIHTHPHTHGGEGWGGVIPSDGSTEGTTIMVNPDTVVIQSKIAVLENKISELDKLIGELRNKYTGYTQETQNLQGDALARAQNSIITTIDDIIPVLNEKIEYLKDINKLLNSNANNLQGDALDANKEKVEQIDAKMANLQEEIADYTNTKNGLQAVIKEQFTTIEPFVGSMYATF